MENCVEKQNQLQKQIDELLDENKRLLYEVNVLTDCLTREQLEKKISELANKQKLIAFAERTVIRLKAETQPLSYLRQVLEKKCTIPTLSADDFDVQVQKLLERPVLVSAEPENRACADETTLDSSSDVNSENGSVVILSDCDVVLEEEVFNDDTDKGAVNKVVMYEEALQMASSVHLLSVESPTMDFESTRLSPSDQNKLEYDRENNGSTTQNVVFNESSSDYGVKPLNIEEEVDAPVLVDSWVKIDSSDIFKESEQVVEICQAQKDNSIPEVNTEVTEAHSLNDKLVTHQLESKDLGEIKSDGNVSGDVNDSKNDIQDPVSLTNISNEEIDIHSSSLETEGFIVSHDCSKSKVNPKDEIGLKNDQLCKYQFESRNDDGEIKSFINVNNNVDNCCEKTIYIPVCSTSEVEVDICKYIFNPGVFQVNNGLLASVEENVISSSSDYNLSQKNNSSFAKAVGERLSPIINDSYFTGSAVSRKLNNLSANLNEKLSPFGSVNNLMESCIVDEFNVMGLKAELLTAFHKHGFQDFKGYQKLCINCCINGNDVIYHSYPCVGKSTIGILSVLQKIDTSLNKCQAIVLVPTIELALHVQKMIESFGKFLNVSTSIGSVDVLREAFPAVPHVVISTLQPLVEMINCRLLCKDFVNLLVIDDADELFNCVGFYDQIEHVLLYFNKDCRLMIFSTSKIDEILDLFSGRLHNPEYIIKPEEKPCLADLTQYQVDLREEHKFDAVCELYEGLNLTHTVVYCNTRRAFKEISENMSLMFSVSAIHKMMGIDQRQAVLQKFRSGVYKMLVTDGGFQRGEEFPEVKCVINYDLPKCAKDYVRRIVGIFNRKIKVINFITANDATAKANIETAFNVHMHHLPQNLFNSHVTDLD